jgi:archaeal flagellin FlaB
MLFLKEQNKSTTRATMRKAFSCISKNQKGITGLETAIILIAFVVVASVFAYVVLSAGLFSSQKSQESVYQGLKTAQNTIEMKGALIAVTDSGFVSQLSFTLANAGSGGMQDFTPPLTTGTNGRCPANSENKVVVSYVDAYQKIDDLFWTMTKIGASGNDYILDTGEIFQITIGSVNHGANGGNLIDALFVRPLDVNTPFTLEVKPPLGATLILERTTPGYLDHVVSLH